MLSISLNVYPNNAFADGLLVVKKGTICPYDGYLLDQKQASKLYTELEDCDRIKLINTSLNKSIELYKSNEVEYKTEISDLKIQNNNLVLAVDKATTDNTWKNILWFSLGAIVTGFVIHETR